MNFQYFFIGVYVHIFYTCVQILSRVDFVNMDFLIAHYNHD